LGHVGIGWDTSQAILPYSDFTCRAISAERGTRVDGSYHAHWLFIIERGNFEPGSSTKGHVRALGVSVDYAGGPDKIEHADRSVKRSIAVLFQQLPASVAIITDA